MHAAPVPRPGSAARRCTRSGSRAARRRGSRRCGCTSRGTAARPTSCASPSWPASSGRCRCRRSSSTRGTPGGPTPRSPTSGGSTWTRCRRATSRRVRRVAHVAHEVLDELGAVGWPKTSGGKGLHIYVRIEPRWGFKDVRRAALAFAREVERRAPDEVTTTWWRKDRDPRGAVRRLQPERPRPHHRQRRTRVRGNARRHGVDADGWGEIDDVRPRTSPSRRCRRGIAEQGRPARRHR